MTTLSCDFAGTLESAGRARAWAARYLDGCPNADDTVLLLSELVANAALYSRSGNPGGKIHVRLVIAAGVWIRCEVRDEGPALSTAAPFCDGETPADQPSAVTEPDELAEAGRGLWLIRTLATETGADGKGLHWFKLPWRPTQAATGTPGPQPRTIPEDIYERT